jgi:acetyl esterase/lipase
MLGAVVYMMCTLMLALVQRSLIYFPTRAAAVLPADAGLPSDRVSAVQITSEDGLTLHGWHVLPSWRGTETLGAADSIPSAEDAVILYFSGNAGHRGYRGDELRTLADLDAQVFLFDYRGYGENPGRPTEKDLIRDARTAWQYLVDAHKIDPARIILFGESLGGGVAVQLAADLCGEGTAPGGLILRSTFSSLVDVA